MSALSIRGARIDALDVDLVVEALAIGPDGDSPAFIDLEFNVAAHPNPIEAVAIFLPIAAAERLVAVVGEALDAHRRGDYGDVEVWDLAGERT